MSSSGATQVASLAKLLVRHVCNKDDKSLIASAVDTLTATPSHSGRAPSDEDAQADALFDRIEARLRNLPQLASVQKLRAKLMSAGAPGSQMAPFKHKGSLVDFLFRMMNADVLHGIEGHAGRKPYHVATVPASSLPSATSAVRATTNSAQNTSTTLDHAFNLPARVTTTTHVDALRPIKATNSPMPPKLSDYGPPPATEISAQTSAAPITTADYVAAVDVGLMPINDELALIRDLLFVFQGIDGSYVKLDIDGQTCSLNVPLRSRDAPIYVTEGAAHIVQHVGKLGWLYARVRGLMERDEMPHSAMVRVRRTDGLIRQAFLAAVRAELDEYYRQLALLDAELSVSDHGGTALEAQYKSKWSLLRVQFWSGPPLALLQVIAEMLEDCDGKIGGALLSALHAQCGAATPDLQPVIARVLCRACHPLCDMLQEWITTGELKFGVLAHLRSKEDFEMPMDELALAVEMFIGSRETTATEEVWRDKFFVIPGQIPSFFSRELVEAVVETGKAVHYMRTVCDDNEWVVQHMGRALVECKNAGIALPVTQFTRDMSAVEDSSVAIKLSDDTRALLAKESRDVMNLSRIAGNDATGARVLEALLAVLRPMVNTRLLDLLMRKNQLMGHLRAMQRYVLLTQGDFVSVLIAAISDELDKPAASASIARHSLEGMVESAIRASNAQFEEKEVLRRLNVKILYQTPGDTGWDVFTLQYELPQPLLLLLPQSTQEQYGALFHFLWKIKRVEHQLNATWSKHMSASHTLRTLRHGGLNGILHMCHLLRTDMTNFVSNLMSYLNFEVLAPAWDRFALESAAVVGLDALLHVHDRYVQDMLDRSLMTERTKGIFESLRLLLMDCLRFCGLQAAIVEESLKQAEIRREAEKEIAARASSGTWGVPIGTEDIDALDERIFGALSTVVATYGPRVAVVTRDYRSRLAALLRAMDMAAFTDGLEELRTLVLRFDYNEYYGTHVQTKP